METKIRSAYMWLKRNGSVITYVAAILGIFLSYFTLNFQAKELRLSVDAKKPQGLLEFTCPDIGPNGIGVTNITFYNDGPQMGQFDVRVKSNDVRVSIPPYFNEVQEDCVHSVIIKSKSGKTYPLDVTLNGRTPSFTVSIGCLSEYCLKLKSQIYHYTCDYSYVSETHAYSAERGGTPKIKTDQEEGYCGRTLYHIPNYPYLDNSIFYVLSF